MAKPCIKNQAPSSSCVNRVGLGLPVSPELMEMGLARHQEGSKLTFTKIMTLTPLFAENDDS